jgi:hypothetical protein
VHDDIIADIVEPAPQTVAGFSLHKPFRQAFRNSLTTRKRFDMSGKSPA